MGKHSISYYIIFSILTVLAIIDMIVNINYLSSVKKSKRHWKIMIIVFDAICSVGFITALILHGTSK